MKKLKILFIGLLAAPLLNGQSIDFEKKGCKNSHLEKNQTIQKSGNYKNTRASDNFSVGWYGLNFTIDPAFRYVKGSVKSNFIMKKKGAKIIWDLAKQLSVDSVVYQNNSIEFLQKANNTVVTMLPIPLAKNETGTMEIYYHGTPPLQPEAISAFFKADHNGSAAMFTESQPFGAYTWWPCRNGLDDKADSIDIFITHPNGTQSTSNGLKISEEFNGNKVTTHFHHGYPIATYLVAIAVANYVEYTDYAVIGGDSLPIVSKVFADGETDFRAFSDSLVQAIELFSEMFGDYPFKKELYGQTQVEFPTGMEHQTNSFMGFIDLNLQNHELAHHWFGNKVTCASWEDIWLNEGAAEYIADFLFPALTNDTLTYRQNVKLALQYIVSEKEGSVRVDDKNDNNRIFDFRLSYVKGSFLNRMMQKTLGDSLFFKGWYNFVNDPELIYGFATTADYQHQMEEVSELDLQYFFDQWFTGQGYPSIKLLWNQHANTNKIYFKANQETSHPSVAFFKMPLPILLKGATEQEMAMLKWNENGQFFSMPNPSFEVEEVLIDPEKWFITKGNQSKKIDDLFGLQFEQSDLNQQAKISTLQLVETGNPINNSITIKYSGFGIGDLKLQLIDEAGRIIETETIENKGEGENKINYSLQKLAKGIYLLSASDIFGNSNSIKILK